MGGDGDAAALSRVHAAAFRTAWTEQDVSTWLARPEAFAMLAGDTSGAIAGFALLTAVAGEAEVLTTAVLPELRRRGIGRSILEAAAAESARRGALRLVLEVGEDNIAALALYASMGFVEIGRRKGYYVQERAGADARVLALGLATSTRGFDP